MSRKVLGVYLFLVDAVFSGVCVCVCLFVKETVTPIRINVYHSVE